MDDTIRRQAAIDAICNDCCGGRYDCKYYPKCDNLESIQNLPSAQPEIIRCKDCKHRPVDGEDTQGFGVEFPDEMCPCHCEDGWYNWRPDDEWYCANAERKDEEEDQEGE